MGKSIRKLSPRIAVLPKRKRVAAYARVSSGKDAMLHSLSSQVNYYSDYIQKHPEWEYAGVYADEAMTGTKDSRPEFQRILADCRAGKVDMIITKSISRFARNTVTLLTTVRELKEIGVSVFFEKEGLYSNSGEGEMILTLLASVAQEESRAVSENCKWRIRDRFKKGELANLRFLYGYRIVKGMVQVEPAEAKIVHMIFDLYLGGMGTDRLANLLTQLGIPKPRGGEWKSTRVIEILRNEKYTGNALLQKKYVCDHLTKKELRNKGELPKYYAEETHSPIIDLDTFQRVQALLEKNRQENNIAKLPPAHYPFSGKILCMNCGERYYRKDCHGKVNWQCSTYLHRGRDACPAKQIPEDLLYSLCTEVLGLKQFDTTTFSERICEIQVPDANLLTFVFTDGHTEARRWKDRSRSESWTEEMRLTARERQNEYLLRGGNLNGNC